MIPILPTLAEKDATRILAPFKSVGELRTEGGQMTRIVRRTIGIFAALALLLGTAAAAHAAPFTFTNVADSARDNFNPNSFTCASLNNRGDVAFRAGRTSPDGLNSFDGIYRANADRTLTTIAEDPNRTKFGFLGNNPSMNDLGEVSFAANLAPGLEEAILRGDGKKLTTIAAQDRFLQRSEEHTSELQSR